MTQMTDQITEQTDEQAPSPADDQAEFLRLAMEVKEEAEALDVGDLPKTEEERTLYRFLRRRAQLESERLRIKDQLAAMDRDLANRVKGLDYVYLPLVEQTVRTLLAHGKAKSIKTPFGVAGFRTQPVRISVLDEARLIEASKQQPQLQALIRVKEEANYSAVKDHFEKTGELAPGCELLGGGEKFYVK